MQLGQSKGRDVWGPSHQALSDSVSGVTLLRIWLDIWSHASPTYLICLRTPSWCLIYLRYLTELRWKSSDWERHRGSRTCLKLGCTLLYLTQAATAHSWGKQTTKYLSLVIKTAHDQADHFNLYSTLESESAPAPAPASRLHLTCPVSKAIMEPLRD